METKKWSLFSEFKVEGCEISADEDKAKTRVCQKARGPEVLGSLSSKATLLRCVEDKWQSSCMRMPGTGRMATSLLKLKIFCVLNSDASWQNAVISGKWLDLSKLGLKFSECQS